MAPDIQDRLTEARYHGEKARSLFDSKQDKEAEPLLRRAIALRKTVLSCERVAGVRLITQTLTHYKHSPLLPAGKREAIYSLCLYLLALLDKDFENHIEAAALFQETLAIRERIFTNTDNPIIANEIAEVYDELGLCYLAQGCYAEAEQYLGKALAQWLTGYGPHHRLTAISQSHMAMLFHVQGRMAEAEALFLEALRLLCVGNPPDDPESYPDPDYAATLHHYAALLWDTNRKEDAWQKEVEAQHIWDRRIQENTN